jgi:hypothetical protein
VNILFGLVVTAAVAEFAQTMVVWQVHGIESINETRLAHLLVAITLTTLSFVGYYQSQQNPPFLMKFINIPLEQFVLDVSMVITYYVAVVMAKSGGVAGSIRPETALIAVAFFLYFLWDFFGYRLGRDRVYNETLNEFLKDEGGEPKDRDGAYGPRRWVTVAYLLIAVVLGVIGWWVNPRTPGPIIAIDGALLLVIVTYRLAKPLADRQIKTRA